MKSFTKWDIIGIALSQLAIVLGVLFKGGSVWIALQVGGAIFLGSGIGFALVSITRRYGVIE